MSIPTPSSYVKTIIQQRDEAVKKCDEKSVRIGKLTRQNSSYLSRIRDLENTLKKTPCFSVATQTTQNLKDVGVGTAFLSAEKEIQTLPTKETLLRNSLEYKLKLRSRK